MTLVLGLEWKSFSAQLAGKGGDEGGSNSQLLDNLADEVEREWKSGFVPLSANPAQVMALLNIYLAMLPPAYAKSFCERHAKALELHRKFAAKAG